MDGREQDEQAYDPEQDPDADPDMIDPQRANRPDADPGDPQDDDESPETD